MTAFRKALYSFWSAFTLNGQPLPAYPHGEVPEKAALPYLTFAVSDGAFFRVNRLTAFVWIERKSGTSARGEMSGVLDQIARAIPEGGHKLTYPGGMAILERAQTDFMTDYDVPDDLDAIGARVAYDVRYYNY